MVEKENDFYLALITDMIENTIDCRSRGDVTAAQIAMMERERPVLVKYRRKRKISGGVGGTHTSQLRCRGELCNYKTVWVCSNCSPQQNLGFCNALVSEKGCTGWYEHLRVAHPEFFAE